MPKRSSNKRIKALQRSEEKYLQIVETTEEDIWTAKPYGTGVPEEVKPKLFTPMVTTKSKGQGLGLAVVKRLVEALNGTVGL